MQAKLKLQNGIYGPDNVTDNYEKKVQKSEKQLHLGRGGNIN